MPAGLASAKPNDLPGPRDPLTFRDMGLYGGWNEYWFHDDCPFNFYVVQAWVSPEGSVSAHGMSVSATTWNDWLKRARAKGYRVIAVVSPAGWKKAPDKVAALKAGIDLFMKAVDKELLYAITLAEEGIYWDGHHEAHKEAYKYVKETYDVPAYQWYSPAGSPPGFGYPHLPADGWLTDEYCLGGPSYENFIRSYVSHQLPVVQVVWASPLYYFDWDARADPAFDWQIQVDRKYNIPTAFFTWEGRGGDDNTWGWSPEAMPQSKAVYERAVMWARKARQTDLKAYEGAWDDIPCLRPQEISPNADGSFVFAQDFMASGCLAAAGAISRGFRDVRWDGGPLELRPRKNGPATVEMLYPLQSQFSMKDLKVTLIGRTDRKLNGEIRVSVSTDGARWTNAASLPAEGTLSLDLSNDPAFGSTRNLQVRLLFSGKSKNVGDGPAAVESIKVEGKIIPPDVKEVWLESFLGSNIRWSTSFPGDSALFTAEVGNANGLAADEGGLCIRGIAGHSNTVSVRQKFVCPAGMDLRKIVTKNFADGVNYAASNTLGVSLDGKNVLLSKSTVGKVVWEDLAIEMPEEDQFKNVREFYVHMTMSCGAGVVTPVANRISALTVEGVDSRGRWDGR